MALNSDNNVLRDELSHEVPSHGVGLRKSYPCQTHDLQGGRAQRKVISLSKCIPWVTWISLSKSQIYIHMIPDMFLVPCVLD